MAEGAPLLREYVPKAHRGFESLRLRQLAINTGPGGPFAILLRLGSGLNSFQWHAASLMQAELGWRLWADDSAPGLPGMAGESRCAMPCRTDEVIIGSWPAAPMQKSL